MGARSRIAAALTAVVAVGLAGVAPQPPAAATVRAVEPSEPPRMPSVPGGEVAVKPAPADPAAEAAQAPVPEPEWPTPDSATATTGGGSVQTRVLDQDAARTAGVDGLLVRVEGMRQVPADQEVKLSIDYSRLRNLRGGDWASRLRLLDVERDAVLRSVNDVEAGRLSATVAAGSVGSTFAVTAAADGAAGDYAATPLAPSGQWAVSTQSGAFSWSYDLRTPPVPGGLAPPLSLSYSSGSVDGKASSTNNQASWLGEGWTLWPGFVERSYRGCADVEGKPETGDLCWVTENAVMSLGGTTVELVREGTSQRWRPKTDDGTRVEQRFDTAANGDVRGEYWVVTTTDGVRYHYGSRKAAESTWTVPVFGDSPGDGCGGTFATSDCVRAWRWNLDHVVDPRGNTISYQYRAESNQYARNQTASSVAAYTRGGWLERIDYGHRAGEAPAAQVVFAVDNRCRPGATCSQHTGAVWPDVPWDWECTGSSCPDKFSPTFWTTKRLASVTTRIRSGSAYVDVDRWSLAHLYPDPGDGTSASLWLQGITHTGLVGGSQSLPPVTFAGATLANRVDAVNDGPPPLKKYRIQIVHNGSGGDVVVDYAPTNCKAGSLPTPAANTLRCFPARWVMTPEPEPRDDWFHVYVVNKINLTDRVGGGMTESISYTYDGGGAWRYDTNPVVAEKYRTWSLWRGYEKVQVRHGDPVQEPERPVSLTKYQYFRGMHGDRNASGGTKTINVVDSASTSMLDLEPLAGRLREEITYVGDGGAVLTGAIHDPWVRGPTATQGTLQAHQVETARTVTRTPLAGGGTRRTQADTLYDNEGHPTRVNDLGDLSTAEDDLCTNTTYARNESSWLLNLPRQVTTVGVACGGTASYPADAVSNVRTYYDGLALDAAPSAGNPTKVEEVDSYQSGVPRYLTVSTATYDPYGRVLDAVDALNRKTVTGYEPTTGPLTQSTTTNPLGHKETTTWQPAWGLPLSVVTASQTRTDLGYDPLGRLVGVWRPGRSKADYPNGPSLRYGYGVRDDAPTWVRIDTLKPNTNYVSGFTLFDGFLRARQVQAPSPAGGRILTDSVYDSRGLTYLERGPYYQSAAPGTALVEPDLNKVPTMTLTRFDGAERPTDQIFMPFNAEPADGKRWRTTTTYGGDRVTVTPTTGGTTTTTVVDARGQTIEGWLHRGTSPTSDRDVTRYSYTKSGEIAQVTDPAGNVWRNEYDVRGRMTLMVDPDAGRSVLTYDAADQLASTTDARGQTISHDYDTAGHRTGTRQGSTQLAKWVYHPSTGQLTSSTRYQAGAEYTRTVTGYDAGGRPTGEQVTFPGTEIGLAGTATFTTTMSYTVDGNPNIVRLPALGNAVPAEALTHSYDAYGNLAELKGNTATGATSYVNRAAYTPLGEPELLEHGHPDAGPHVWRQWTYEDSTRRLASALTEREKSGSLRVDLLSYAYDPIGNVTSVKDELPGITADNQCFRYDHLRRLVDGWTQAGACATAPSTAVVGGPAPYWHTYGYDTIGNRTSLNRRGLGGAADKVSTYTYPAAGQPRPHAVSSVQTTGAGTATYGYNATGHTTSRPGTSGQQTLTWDTENKLSSVTVGETSTSYRYDADGNQLIRRDPTTVTVFLGDSQLVYDTVSKATTGSRYYRVSDRVVAVRTGATTHQWLVGDHHGTSQLTVDPVTLAATPRRFDPFGNPRGTAVPWIGGSRGFVGGTPNEVTGLTRLGAREYDPAIGRFISVDPFLDLDDPQQMNGYAYANNNPVTMSDPTGLIPAECGVDVECYGYHPHTGCPKGCGTTANQELGQQRKPKRPNNNSGGKGSKPRNTKPKPFDFEYLKKHGRPHPDTDIRVWDNREVVWDILEACGWAFGDADCDMKFHLWVVNRHFELLGYPGGSAEVMVSGGSWPTGKRGRGLRFCGRSFDADTLVLMADGSTKPISEVRPGDRVLATDPTTGERSARTVTAVWAHDDELVELEIRARERDGTGEVTRGVTTTDDHLFWNVSDRQWQPASALDPGDRLLVAGSGHATVVGLLERTRHADEAYTLTIDTTPTYYVFAGDTPLLVHNAPGCWPGLGDLSASGARPAKGGRTQAGREYQKHMDRDELPKVPGKDLDRAGQDLLDDILTTPGTQRFPIEGGNFAGGYYYMRPDGQAAAFDSSGMFQYFGKFKPR